MKSHANPLCSQEVQRKWPHRSFRRSLKAVLEHRMLPGITKAEETVLNCSAV